MSDSAGKCKEFVNVVDGAQKRPRFTLSDRVLFQFTHKLANPFDTRFPLAQILNKFQARRTIKAVMLRLFLQQTNQPGAR